MKTQFTPIAMRCTKEQFKAVEPKLKKHGLKAKDLSSFNLMPYLINNRLGEVNNITNYSARIDWKKTEGIKKVYETWDEAKFLKACGIEVDTYTVSKDFILEAHESACSTWKTKIENQFPELFPKVELEVGKWYKNNDYPNLVYLKKITEKRDIKKEFGTFGIGYGFDFTENPKWDNNLVFANTRNFILATKEEVETALIAEVKKRGFKEGCFYNWKDMKKCKAEGVLKMGWSTEYDLYFQASSGFVFKDGKWAEIISEPIELSLEEIAEKFGVDVSLIKIKK